jgi:hypothetical protein
MHFKMQQMLNALSDKLFSSGNSMGTQILWAYNI